MLKLFAFPDKNLARAASIAVLAVICSAALSFTFTNVGVNPSLATLFCLACFLLVGWFMAGAAKDQGRSPWLYGIASIAPPLALLAFISLYGKHVDFFLSQRSGPGHDA